MLVSKKSSAESSGNLLIHLSQEDRINLCNVGRKYYVSMPVPYILDTVVPEAQLYSFQYQESQQEAVNFAIYCPAFPSIFLSLENSSERSTIKIVFEQTVADNYHYEVDVVDSVDPKDTGKLYK